MKLKNKQLQLKSYLLQSALNKIFSIDKKNLDDYIASVNSIEEDLSNQLATLDVLCSGDETKFEQRLWEMDTLPREHFVVFMNKVLEDGN